jgi:molecular chaperone DnaK
MKNSSTNRTDNSVITIGIDLGTTNSAIAISQKGVIEHIKSGPGQPEYTPSVFGIDKSGNKIVGQKAYEKLFKSASDEEFANYKAEVKRLMGTAETITFDRLGESMTPEQVSAEILKSLVEDVTRKYSDFSTLAAVVTIPAYFSSLQSEATKRAGELAGFKQVVLLQEPIAAAMAYGFENAQDQNWIVYDLGGGTFDVALISSKDGILSVLGHNGDNFLGGKDFDLKIVDEVIKPAILEKYNLKDFDRSNDKYKAVFARLKAIAEEKKIELSQYDKVTLEVEDVFKDDDGTEVYVSIDFTRTQFEELISSLVGRTIDLAKKTLADSGVQSSAISKIVLVGGPTQIPYVRESLKNEFELSIDTSADPLTVVARGACVYGLSQRVSQELLEKSSGVSKETLKLELHYDPMTSDDETTVTGKITSLADVEDDYFVQIQSDSGTYSSSKIRLRNGKFSDTVAVEKGKTTTFWIYLFDKDSNVLPVFPESFSVTHGLTVSGAPIPHAIGVVYAKRGFDNDFQFKEACDLYFDRDSKPPLRETRPYKTAWKLYKNQDNALPIKVYEGESSNPDNNDVITTLHIKSDELPYDLPEGTAVDITIAVDESRAVTVEAYIPSIDKTLDVRADRYAQPVDTKKLSVDLEAQKDRLKKVSSDIPEDEQSKLENKIDSLETNIKNSENDTDDRQKAERDMRELKSDLEKIEQDRSIPQLSEDFYEKLQSLKSMVDGVHDEDERTRIIDVLNAIEAEGKKAIADKDKELLVRLNEQLHGLIMAILLEDPTIWIGWLDNIKARKAELTNQTIADHLIAKADEAAAKGDVEGLKRNVRELFDLLPDDAEDEIKQGMSGITR